MYSTRKPYQRLGLSRTRFFSAAARHLLESNSEESVFEKPYLDQEYQDMHQSPNVPKVPQVEGGIGGGLSCYYAQNACGEGIECFAGTGLTIDGPQSAQAGFLPPTVNLGGIISYQISELQDRKITITLDETQSIHSVLVGFKDGLGIVHNQTVDINCSKWTAYLTDVYWTVTTPPGAGTWDGTKWIADFVPGDSSYTVGLDVSGGWASGFRPTKIRVTHTSSDAWLIIIDTNSNVLLSSNPYTSRNEIDITFQGFDIGVFGLLDGDPAVAFNITNIEFFE